EVHAGRGAAVLDTLLAAGALDEDAAHGFGGRGEEVAAVTPLGLPGRMAPQDQPQVGFVDEGGGLERLAGLLLGQLLGREPPQLVIDQRQELARRVGVAFVDGRQDTRDVAHGIARPAGPQPGRSAIIILPDAAAALPRRPGPPPGGRRRGGRPWICQGRARAWFRSWAWSWPRSWLEAGGGGGAW